MSPDAHHPDAFAPQALDEWATAAFATLHQATAMGQTSTRLDCTDTELTMGLPPLGEGTHSIVYPLEDHSLKLLNVPGRLCVKLAKPAAISRETIMGESASTAFFLSEMVPVPRIHYMDPCGRFCIKDLIEGESLTSVYLRWDRFCVQTQRLLLDGIEPFLRSLVDLFNRKGRSTSLSPNNIYIVTERGCFKDPVQCVLVDPGHKSNKDYKGLDLNRYWNEVIPDRIRKYREFGYLQWISRETVTRSERDESTASGVFRSMTAEEIERELDFATPTEFTAGEEVFHEKALGKSFYLIVEGEVELRRGAPGSPGAWSERVGRGSVLSEAALLLRIPHSASAVALTPCRLLQIDCEPFHSRISSGDASCARLLSGIAAHLAERHHDAQMWPPVPWTPS